MVRTCLIQVFVKSKSKSKKFDSCKNESVLLGAKFGTSINQG